MRSGSYLLVLLALILSAAPSVVSAQAGTSACPQGRISRVFIDNHSVFDLSDPDREERLDWAYRLANRFHIATQPEVIRREILFEEGDCYDPAQLQGSERLLRAADFIADVDVYGIRQANGTVHVIVDTRDEWSLRLDPRIGAGENDDQFGIRLREDNLLGSGQHVSVFYLLRRGKRVYGLSYRTPQLFESRWDFEFEVGKTPMGYLFSENLSYPYVGESGRWALLQSLRHRDRYFEFVMPRGDELVEIWFPERRRSLSLGGVYRWGERRYQNTLLGMGLTGEWISYPEAPRFAREEDVMEGPLPIAPFALDSISSVRAMLLMGQRNVYFRQQRGLNTVRGEEDVRLGVETELGIGPSVPGLSSDEDFALDFGLFVAGELPAGFLVGGELALEARRNYERPVDRSEWGDVYGQLDAWAYWHPSPESRYTTVAALTAAGGWHNTVPFQLTLGGGTGLRGYPRHLFPGGRRIVASLEQRAYLGWPLPDLFDLGGVAFVDAGRIWAGDAPFGVDSPYRVGVGLGLRAAFPPGSRRTFRLDVGVPLVEGAGWGDVQISVGVGQFIGNREAGRDSQLERSSFPGLSTSLFSFPN